ncbi:hypothetical protein HMPREF1032_03201 [Subdoligranulum sp. 4_3_54A2FAA]|jgi:hypothetical protein|nr:hypothetical protein HMPREF1032_03201 [Subdoligranulum sp. 4_3_54A2FAA]
MKVNMKYLAFRIDTTAIKSHEVVHGYFVRGQRNTDYNWSLLAEFDNMDSAKEYIKSIRTDPVQQLVYGPDGYGIRI